MQRLVIVLVLLSAAGCGRIGPGAANRPAATGEGPSESSGGGSNYGPSRPVFDDKGCANASGESGQAAQAACRQGK